MRPRHRLAAFAVVAALVAAGCSSSDDGSADTSVEATDGGTDTGASAAGSGAGTGDTANGSGSSDESDGGEQVAPRPNTGLVPVGRIADGAFTATFDGAPASPQPWTPANWDLVVHSRDGTTFEQLETMQAQHGHDCGAPPATHEMNSYADAVFLCRDHLMTSIQAEAYALIYLTPDAMVDFSKGEAVVAWDMSTARDSIRDWPDVWITPYDDNLALPLELQYPDLSGPPRNALHVTMGRDDGFRGAVYRDFEEQLLPEASPAVTLKTIPGFEQSPARRDRFELHVTATSVRFGIKTPSSGMVWFVEATFADLGWTRGVVQLGHHSYNPRKECVEGVSSCAGGTWHWDNVSIAPAVPFSIVRPDLREVGGQRPTTITLPAPSAAGAHLRFGAVGKAIEVSFDGGTTWVAAERRQTARETLEEHFASYWMPLPAGTTSVSFRGERWWGGPWLARDITVWSQGSAG